MITITCWGCNKTITKSVKELFTILQEGWVKRSFSPTSWSWFCSHTCAYQSYHAMQAEYWWKEHNKKSVAWGLVIPGSIFIFSLLFVLFKLFMR
jgi:hypothetical protein